MKTLFPFIIGLLILPANVSAQLKITPGGLVGIGTSTPASALHVQGSVHFTDGGNTLRLMPDNGGVEIGSSTGLVTFWFGGNYNDLIANSFTPSDANLKKDIVPLTNCTSIIKSLNGYKYHMKQPDESKLSPDGTERLHYGVMAQELKKVLPDLIKENKGVQAVNYTGLIPVLLEGFKEQQNAIESQNKKIDSLNTILSQVQSIKEVAVENNSRKIDSLAVLISQCCSMNFTVGNTGINDHGATGKLYQNTPNPYTTETQIRYELPAVTASASIAVFDLQGTLKKSYPLPLEKNGFITIKAGEFSQGIYIYSLIANHQEVASKRMILIE